MNAILDTTKKTFTIDQAIRVSDLNRILSYILPGYGTSDVFTLNISSLKNVKDAIEVRIPIKTDYSYDPAFTWLEYKGTENIKLTDGMISDHSRENATFLINGVFNLNIIL